MKNVPAEWGIMMASNGPAICEAIAVCLSRFDPFTYVEIGMASAGTLGAISRFLSSCESSRWRAVGFDLPNGSDLNRGCAIANLGEFLHSWIGPGLLGEGWSLCDGTTVILESGAEFISSRWNLPIHWSMIDACHCRRCVAADFIAVEPFIPIGGMVCFHDSSPGMQGGAAFSFHDVPVLIGVREALIDLGLDGDRRYGWKTVLERDSEGGDAGISIYERVNDNG